MSAAMTESSIKAFAISQQISAYSFLSFLTLHISSPIAAALSSPGNAESSASRMMLLGREYYQNGLTEMVFVWGALGVHVGSGIIVRGLKVIQRRERRVRKRKQVVLDAEKSMKDEEDEELPQLKEVSLDEMEDEVQTEEFQLAEGVILPVATEAEEQLLTPSSSTSLLPPINIQHITGYVLIPLTLLHARLHRLIPSSPLPPISSLSPTLFSYSFVSYNLSSLAPTRRRLWHAACYGVLVSVATYHVVLGARIYRDNKSPRSLKPKRGKRSSQVWRVSYASVIGTVGIGLARLAAEGGRVPLFMQKRYEDVLALA